MPSDPVPPTTARGATRLVAGAAFLLGWMVGVASAGTYYSGFAAPLVLSPPAVAIWLMASGGVDVLRELLMRRAARG